MSRTEAKLGKIQIDLDSVNELREEEAKLGRSGKADRKTVRKLGHCTRGPTQLKGSRPVRSGTQEVRTGGSRFNIKQRGKTTLLLWRHWVVRRIFVWEIQSTDWIDSNSESFVYIKRISLEILIMKSVVWILQFLILTLLFFPLYSLPVNQINSFYRLYSHSVFLIELRVVTSGIRAIKIASGRTKWRIWLKD